MSLVGSIFGNESFSLEASKGPGGANESSVSGLFDSSTVLPDKPQHKPVPKRNKPKVPSDKEDLGGTKPNRKKRRKDEGGSKDSETSFDANNSDEHDAMSRTIFVGNLPLKSTTRSSLRALFVDCGKIETVRLRGIPTTGVKVAPEHAGNQNLVKKICANTNQVDLSAKSTIQGYVVFASVDSVEPALKKNNMKLPDRGGRIRVDRAEQTRDPARSIFVGNLPYGAEEATLRSHVCRNLKEPETTVENVRIVRDPSTNQCKGFGYVLFQDRQLVTCALAKLPDTLYMRRPLRVMVCGKRFKGRRGAQTDIQRIKKRKPVDAAGALKRLLKKEKTEAPKRKRAAAKAKKGPSTGMSKRQLTEAKVEKRVKKLQKRMTKGMGKARKK